jgi:alpha-L-fucosidase
MDAQLRELLTNYGPLAGVWLDGFWDRSSAEWRLARTYQLINTLQPGALIASNHNGVPHPGEDLITFERVIRPDQLPAGNTLPVEVSEKINDTWGFRLHDVEYKSADSLIRELVRTAGSDANFLLNVGPMPDGRIQPEAEERLRAMGRWMERFGRTIVATRGGPLAPRAWGVTTQRGDTVWVHILDWPDPLLALPLARRFRGARLLNDGSPVRVEQGEGVTLHLPPQRPAAPDLIVELDP